MLTHLRKLWHDASLMGEVMRHLGAMIDDSQALYLKGWEACAGTLPSPADEEDARQRDKAVNRHEREVRSLLVQHLTINPGRDISGCLAVMIMAKDLERLGDHARSLFNLGLRTDGLPGYLYFERLNALHQRIATHFPELKEALLKSDETLAHHILANYLEIKRAFKTISGELFEAGLPSREAVTTTLLTGFMTRINAHIGNAASGVIFPLQNIDFVSRGLKEEESDR